MFLLFNSQERTIRQIDNLLRSVKWKVTVVHRRDGGDSTFLQSIEAIPLEKNAVNLWMITAFVLFVTKIAGENEEDSSRSVNEN